MDLSIHEKINTKANSAGFETVFIRSCQTGCCPRLNDFHPEMLAGSWYWHYEHNYFRSLDTTIWIRENKQIKLAI